MALVDYKTLKSRLEAENALSLPTDGSTPISPTDAQQQITEISGTVTIDIPQIERPKYPVDDLDFSKILTGKKEDLQKLLGVKDGKGGKVNSYVGSQVVINSDRLVFNARTDNLLLFGQNAVAISSKTGNVNIDAGDSVTMYGEDGVFIGVPGKGKSLEAGGGNKVPPKNKAQATLDNDYEPMVLGIKLIDLLDDLLTALQSARILALGNAWFAEDTMYDFKCLQARLPELISNYAYLDGLSHDPPLPEPTVPERITIPPKQLTGTFNAKVIGNNFDLNLNNDNKVVVPVTNPLGDDPSFFEGIEGLEEKRGL